MTTQLDAISEAIGQLRADVRNLTLRAAEADKDAVGARDRADNQRNVIQARVEDLAGEIFGLTDKVETMEKTVSDSKQVTDQVKMWQQRGIGALFVAGIAGSALGATVVGFLVYWWDNIMKLLRSVP